MRNSTAVVKPKKPLVKMPDEAMTSFRYRQKPSQFLFCRHLYYHRCDF